FEIEAVAAVAEAQVAVAVRFCVVASSKVPVAVNCCFVPLAIDGVAGVTAIETSLAGETVRVVMPTMVPLVAEMTDVPAPTPGASAVAEIVAVAAVAEAQVTVADRS